MPTLVLMARLPASAFDTLRKDEVHERVDGAHLGAPRDVIGKARAELLLEQENDLDGVDGVECEAAAEERRVRVDLIGIARELQSVHEQLANAIEHVPASIDVCVDVLH